MGSARASMSTPGTYLLTGSSTWSRPASRSCRTTAAMSGLTSEPSANRVSGVTGSAAATSASPWTATCSRASVVSRATARPGAPVCACEARKRSNRSRCGPALTVPEYGDALQPPQRRNGQAPWSDRRAAPGAAATGDLATPPLRALEGARFLEWLPSLRPAAHFNCQLHCMSRVLAAHGRDDALRCLVQPIGFSFEVDLVSRDWLLGGHSEATFHAPVYQRGVSAVWEDVDGDRFLDVIAAERGAGRSVVFQTEWSLVSPDAGHGFDQGHVAAVLDQRGGELYVLDTVGARTAPAIFADDQCGWVPAASYAEAAC